MVKSAIITFLVSYCVFLFSQPITFSRNFETSKKNVPLAIINNHPNYFHVLRYNKKVHDFTVERRDKTSFEILAFTPLKLDLINADWFDYENLDFLFFEHNHKVYFLFEKVRNSEREIFLKVIDTTGIAGSFIQLASLDKSKSVENFKFEFKLCEGNNILVVGSQYYAGDVSKKVVLLYDIEKLENIWVKKLPAETPKTGYSSGFECNKNGDLFYVLLSTQVVSYKRKYIDHKQEQVPVLSYELVAMVSFLNGSRVPVKAKILAKNLNHLNDLSICAQNEQVVLFVHFSGTTISEEDKVFFLTQKWTPGLETCLYNIVTPLDEGIDKQLTFYDGTDFKNTSDKEYTLADKVTLNGVSHFLLERTDGNFYKEFIFVKIDLATGVVLSQEIIPRKILYYKGRNRFKNLELSSRMLCNGNYYSILLENAKNFEKQPRNYRYRKFSKVGGQGHANMVSYILKPDGNIEKKVFYQNDKFSFIPLKTQSAGCDFVFYLNEGAYEKFAILNLNPNYSFENSNE